MNLGLWPAAVPFDPDDDGGSRELEAYLAGVAFPSAALVVAGPGMRVSEWAPRAAIGLARALAATGRDVLLADLEFEAPALDGLLSEVAVEGLADVLLFGASLERVTVMPAGQAFEFLPAGGFAPDARALMADPGWPRLVAELEARGTLFLGYARFDAPGLDQLVARIPSIVLLADPQDAALTVAYLPEELRIEALIRPATPIVAAGEPPATPAESEPEIVGEPSVEAVSRGAGSWLPEELRVPPPPALVVEPDARLEMALAGPETPVEEPNRVRLPKDEAREALIADLQARQRSALARAGAERGGAQAGGSAAPSGPAAEAAHGPTAAPPHTVPVAPSRRRHWLVGAAVLVLAAASTWFFVLRDGAGREAPATAPVLARPLAPPEPVGSPAGWSVAVEAHDRLDMALQSVTTLAAADPSIGFYVSPAVVSGGLWYRVLAGPLADSAEADAVMQRLVGAGLKRAAAVWDVRATPLAFLLGRYQRESDAVGRMNELMQTGVPTYIVEVPYSRGESWYHLYGGAYASPPEAERMGQILRDAGLPDSLVVRVGRILP